jgi:uncharacterized protein YtpQ (UPF0354 family)
MWLSSSVRQRAGALSGSAERFVAERWGGRGEDYRGGHDGLRALCKELERFVYAHDVDEESERRFVEGAGALLGVLLIEHVADAAHASLAGQHRVRLGAYGFFDPFSAVDRALDAPDVRRALASEVAHAEAEAQATGPLSRLVAALSALLAAERPDLTIQAQFECTLTLALRDSDETLELDVRRAVETTRDQQQTAVESVARRLLSILPGAPREEHGALDELHKRLVPRLARSAALRELTSRGQNVLFARPLVSELCVALLLEQEGRARYVRSDELASFGLSPDEALALGLANLRERSARARIVRDELEHGAVFVARSGDGRDSARVLLPELFAELSERIGGQVAVAVPHRDTFFACAADNGALVRCMVERAAYDAARAPHALSPHAFALSSAGLSALEL